MAVPGLSGYVGSPALLLSDARYEGLDLAVHIYGPGGPGRDVTVVAVVPPDTVIAGVDIGGGARILSEEIDFRPDPPYGALPGKRQGSPALVLSSFSDDSNVILVNYGRIQGAGGYGGEGQTGELGNSLAGVQHSGGGGQGDPPGGVEENQVEPSVTFPGTTEAPGVSNIGGNFTAQVTNDVFPNYFVPNKGSWGGDAVYGDSLCEFTVYNYGDIWGGGGGGGGEGDLSADSDIAGAGGGAGEGGQWGRAGKNGIDPFGGDGDATTRDPNAGGYAIRVQGGGIGGTGDAGLVSQDEGSILGQARWFLDDRINDPNGH